MTWLWMSADAWEEFSLELHEKDVISTYMVDLHLLSLFTLLFSSMDFGFHGIALLGGLWF